MDFWYFILVRGALWNLGYFPWQKFETCQKFSWDHRWISHSKKLKTTKSRILPSWCTYWCFVEYSSFDSPAVEDVVFFFIPCIFCVKWSTLIIFGYFYTFTKTQTRILGSESLYLCEFQSQRPTVHFTDNRAERWMREEQVCGKIPRIGLVFVFSRWAIAVGCAEFVPREHSGCCWILCWGGYVCRCTCSFARRVSSTFPWRESQGCECCSCLCRFSATARSRRTRYSPVDWPPPSSTEVCCCFTMFVSQQVFSSVYVRK